MNIRTINLTEKLLFWSINMSTKFSINVSHHSTAFDLPRTFKFFHRFDQCFIAQHPRTTSRPCTGRLFHIPFHDRLTRKTTKARFEHYNSINKTHILTLNARNELSFKPFLCARSSLRNVLPTRTHRQQ